MEVIGKIKVLNETQTFGDSGFRKRECVVTTNEQYPQVIMVEFVQDKTDLLNVHKVGDDVLISINLRGREWVNPQGETKYFNSVQGWRVSTYTDATQIPSSELPPLADLNDDNDDGLPF
jgi:hypothetical protein